MKQTKLIFITVCSVCADPDTNLDRVNLNVVWWEDYIHSTDQVIAEVALSSF